MWQDFEDGRPRAEASAETRRDTRHGRRVGVYEPTRLRPNEWSSVEIQVLDISSLGFRAKCEVRLMKVCFLSLDIPGIGTVRAEVKWQEGGEFGAVFERPIDLAKCSWTPEDPRALLGRMLVYRAAAQRDGKAGQEQMLRRQIASLLPMRSFS